MCTRLSGILLYFSLALGQQFIQCAGHFLSSGWDDYGGGGGEDECLDPGFLLLTPSRDDVGGGSGALGPCWGRELGTVDIEYISISISMSTRIFACLSVRKE